MRNLEERARKREERRARRRFNRAGRVGLFLLGAAALGLISACPNPVGPNYAPEWTSVPSTEVQGGKQYRYHYEARDANGDPIRYFVKRLPPWLSDNPEIREISGTAPDEDASEPIELEAVDDKGAATPQEFSLTIRKETLSPEPPPVDEDYLDARLKLEDCENPGNTALPVQGTLRFYKTDVAKTFLGETSATSNDGYFDFHSTSTKAKDLGDVLIEAYIGNSSSPASYTRTITANVSASSEPDVNLTEPVGVVMYNNPNSSSDDDLLNTREKRANYSRHVELTNSQLGKFDWANFQGIEIMRTNRDGSGYFDNSIVGKVKNDIAQWADGEVIGGELYIQGRFIPVSIVSAQNAHYDHNFANRIVYEPYESGFGAGVYGETDCSPTNGDATFINGALIKLLSNDRNNHNPLDYVRLHEAGHATNTSVGEAYWRIDEMPNPNPDWIDPILSPDGTWNGSTVMETGIAFPQTSTIGPADFKTRGIILSTAIPRRNFSNVFGAN